MSGGFEDLGLYPELVRATQELGWLLPSDVQDEAAPLLLGGGDVLVAAETGSGKTGAFALPAIQIVHEARRAQAAQAAAAQAAVAQAAAAAAAAASSSSSSQPQSKKARLTDAGAGAGAGAGPDAAATACVLSASDRSSMVSLSPSGLQAQCRQAADWGGVRGALGALRGRVFFEAVMTDEGLCRVGWATQAASHNLGTDRHGLGFGGTGKRSHNNKFEAYGAPFAMGDVIGCCLDLGAGSGSGAPLVASFTKNGVPLGEAFSLAGAARPAGALYPAVCLKNAELALNFGATPFRFAPPPGFVGLARAPPEDLAGLEVVAPTAAAAAAAAASGGGSGPGGGHGSGPGGGHGKRAATHPVCIIMEPARDLALQTAKAVNDLKRHVVSPALGCGCLIGGMSAAYVHEQAAAGSDIVVACLSTLLSCVDKREVLLDQVRLLVLDEADRFTEKENLEQLERLFALIRAAVDASAAAAAATPSAGAAAGGATAGAGAAVAGRLQVCFFSATLHSPEISSLAAKMCVRPTWVDLKGKDSVPETVHHVVVSVDPAQPLFRAAWAGAAGQAVPTDGVHAKDRIGGGGGAGGAQPLQLSREERSEAVKRLKPQLLLALIDSLKMAQCLIFCRTNLDCDNLEAFLTRAGGGAKWRAGAEKGKENRYSCCVLGGARGQEERTRNLQAFRDGDVRFLVCTDVAARGLDIKELPYVVNLTLPDEPEQYIHRIGRVGRADRMGLAISLVAAPGCDEKVWFHTCGARYGKGCANTALVNMASRSGGCATWYDEPAKFGAIRRRLGLAAGARLPEMLVAPAPPAAPAGSGGAAAGAGSASASPFALALPPEIVDLGASYGDERGAPQRESAHVAEIAGQVGVLLALEVTAQHSYLALKQRFAAGRAGAGGVGGAGGAGAGAGADAKR
jgi:ATP-dependent RNA helicase DDX1